MNMQIRTRSLVFVIPVGLLAPLSANASESAPDLVSTRRADVFGDAGQLVISGAASLSLERTTFAEGNGPLPGPSTSLFIAPSADFFVLRGLTVGARFSYQHADTSGAPAENGLSIGPRVGYNFTLGDHFSIWPTASVTYGETWFGAGSHVQGVSVGGYAPLLYHPVPHFFVGLGPNIQASVTATSSTPQGSADEPRWIQYGVAFAAGGWVTP
jgi:hypothetical protein